MRTYKGKNITKKQIQDTIRALDKSAIWKMVHTIYGGKTCGKQVADFIRKFAPTKKTASKLYEIAYVTNKHKPIPSWQTRNEIRYGRENLKHEVISYLKKNIADASSPYAKRPVIGYTHLYFCSPAYGHRDYNKWCAMPIKGNERFVELVVSLGDKYFGKTC